ncbi:conserved exported hypothetical protein [Candidatus Sulfotelmatobacter sp. SbA7]|nr:conserved exported hypothetical protein [Candidatus Sulfotelmatobacter sp. SbA7]
MLLLSPEQSSSGGASAVTSRTSPRLDVGLTTGKVAATCLVCFCLAFAQSGNSPAPAPQQSSSPPQSSSSTVDSAATADKNSAEMASHDAPAEFKVNVRLVLVRTVVRDTQGHAIGNLNKDDFQLFDNGKPQIIKQFAVEQPGGAAATTQESGKAQPGEAALPQLPDHFVIYLFDDVHLQNKYLVPARIAAEHHLATLRPTDRVAIFTTSGQNNLDFTDDRAKLHDALQRLQPRSLLETGAAECPYMTHYIADQIVNMRDEDALNLVAQDLASCELVGSQTAAQALAESAARRALDVGDAESRLVLGTLKNAVRRISAAPGQRTIVFISPGFLTPQLEDQVTEIIERAVRANVIISALDARGLYTIDPAGDISRPGSPNPAFMQQMFLFESQSESSNQLVL